MVFHYLVEVGGGDGENGAPRRTVLVGSGRVGKLGEHRCVVVSVGHSDVDGGVVGEGGTAAVRGLDSEEILQRSLVVDLPVNSDEAGLRVDGELALLVPPDDGVVNLGVAADIPAGCHHPHHVCSHLQALNDRGEVIFARELRWVVVHICINII